MGGAVTHYLESMSLGMLYSFEGKTVSMQFLWSQISTFDKALIPTTTHFPGN